MVKLLYFAWLRERIGMGSEDVDLPADINTVHDLIGWLSSREERYAHAFKDVAALRVAIDQEQAEMDASIKGAREIALFPPVTGG